VGYSWEGNGRDREGWSGGQGGRLEVGSMSDEWMRANLCV